MKHPIRELINIMEARNVTPDKEKRFTAFVRDSEKISAKHGVLIQAIGNVHIEDVPLEAVRYSDDPTSGDIYPLETKRFDRSAPRPWAGGTEDVEDLRSRHKRRSK